MNGNHLLHDSDMRQLFFVCKRAQGFCVYLLSSAEDSVLMVTQNSVALERGGCTAAAHLAGTAAESEQEALCWFLFNKLCAGQPQLVGLERERQGQGHPRR